MINYGEIPDTAGNELASNHEAEHKNVWHYSCTLSPQHVDPTILPRINARYALESYKQWHASLGSSDDKLGHMAQWIKATIQQMPGGIDIARDVDGGGYTEDKVRPTLFTEWVGLADGSYVRFSESRTAMHNHLMTTKGMSTGGALRSPVMGGVALEVTSDPASTDPRDAVTLAVYGFAKEEDARYPWIPAKLGKLYDFTQFTEEPYFVGPLYNGHPNQINDPEIIDKTIEASLIALKLTVDSNLGQ